MSKSKTALDDNIHWYKDAIIYELHIKAFMDHNGDGIGDFKGLLQKLDYLEDLGVTAIWLLPFYPSPLRDDGYDIADYYQINPSYGSIKHFKKFLKEAHKRNLKVITELVINHTSDQHPWFQRARKAPKGSPERDFYVWTDDPKKYKGVRIIFQDFESSNWSWDPVAKQYYWHRFFHHQPDLNYDNPEVQKEVFKIIDYWIGMGVDGFRLDAVPYLFQREGTNCENLPETHAFLKKLRKHVDTKYEGKMLLAEANMWPEDSAAYFGEGDECHMNYHFPIMPRMFMSLRMEDRYPITDIFDQTPDIPHTCQWAIFLRNHDELTLEMVTDEERDYMYKVYTKDPKAKINLGIRHRLAPLLDNNRKKIELINYLLFSLPGTPVIYYGDEIGMGDNYYLGDRNGVRTPMQWSPDRNAGFSQTNPQKLYLPIILDPEYHYESVNVETQQSNTSSLLWWMKRVINMRKKYKAFSRGNLNFIHSENSKVLVFTRSYEEQTILVVVNLSRFSQAAELDLSNFSGHIPVEVFSKNKFPGIREDRMYNFTLSPHAYHWFALEKEESYQDEKEFQYVLELKKWKDLEKPSVLEKLENNILPDYLQKCRWFGGKARTVQKIKLIENALAEVNDDQVYFTLLEVSYESGLPEIYQLSLAFADEMLTKELEERSPQAIISNVKVDEKEGVLFDALYSKDVQHFMLEQMKKNKFIKTKKSIIYFSNNKSLNKFYKKDTEIKSRVLSVEQSNTSIIFNNAFFLKIYRKLDRSINPDLEITRFLSEEAKFKHIPSYVGAIEWKFGKDIMVSSMMQEMVPNQGDAWTDMLDSLKRYYERIPSTIEEKLIEKKVGSLTQPLAFDQLEDGTRELLGAVVAERTRLLGVRTGEMHKALATSTENPDFTPEEFSLHYQRSLFSSFQSLVRSTYQTLQKNIKNLPEEAKEEAEKIMEMKQDILSTFRKIYRNKMDVVKIRTHGDYHLGQVLFTGKDFVILDFEGEPARSFSERRLKRSPLRDIAGMIRSYHYAAYGGIFLNENIREEDQEELIPWAEHWYHYMSQVYMKAYLDTVQGSSFLPENKEDLDTILKIFLLEKAIYELNYELNNRPDWVTIPIKGIRKIMEQNFELEEL